MFNVEASFAEHARKHGRKQAIEYIADVNEFTQRYLPKESNSKKRRGESTPPDLQLQRTLLDRNEHFIELSNIGEENRSLQFMLAGLFGLMFCMPLFFFSTTIAENLRAGVWFWDIAVFGCMEVGVLTLIYFLWPQIFAPQMFTALRARYRFNRTTGKVYVLRPAKYGGNVILDWDRVQAHVSWRAPRELKPEDLRRDPMARRMRQQSAGGPLAQRCLLLYWPPLKADDPQRTGEDVLWVGPRLADEYLWQYIRTFMEAGIDAVPAPNAYEWLRKGFGSPGDVMSEIELQSFKAIDRLEGRDPNSPSAKTVGMALASAPWSPFHSLSQRLCYWPTFPEEWNSDCGQKRRESGLGPQEPLRWKAK
jgi:hypothetical protein